MLHCTIFHTTTLESLSILYDAYNAAITALLLAYKGIYHYYVSLIFTL